MAGSMRRSKFEIARVDHTKEKVYRNNFGLVVDKIAFPDAKWWQPFCRNGGDMAFKEKRELFTSAFNPNGSGTYKYNFFRSINANDQKVKVYTHCSGRHTILVRQAPSLRVYLSTSQLGETTHMISLKKEDAHGAVIFEKEFDNDGSDITLGQILPVAKCHLIENNHVTYQGTLEVIFGFNMVITTKLSTVLVKRFGRKEPNKKRKTSA